LLTPETYVYIRIFIVVNYKKPFILKIFEAKDSMTITSENLTTTTQTMLYGLDH